MPNIEEEEQAALQAPPEQDVTAAVPEPIAEPEIADEQEPDADAPVRLDLDGVVDENGLLVGKFKDVASLAQGYRAAQSQMGRKSGEAADYRRAMEAAGWTFTDDGKPVAPVPKEQPGATEQTQADAAPDANGHRVVDGVTVDHLGLAVISQEEWDTLREEDFEQYIELKAREQSVRTVRQMDYERTQAARRTEAAQEARTNARKAAVETYGLDDSLVTEIEAEVAKVLPTVAPGLRDSPEAYQMAFQLVAAQRMPAFYRKLMTDALSGNADALKRAQRVVAVERGSAAPPPPASGAANHYGLTAEERKMASDFGISEEKYAANK